MTDRFEALLGAVLETVHLTDLSISEDGTHLAVVAEPAHQERGESATSRVWGLIGDQPPSQLTTGPGSDRLPRWSPLDGRLAFASDRDHRGRMSPFLVAAGGAEAHSVGTIDGFVEDIAWSPGGRSIIVLAADQGLDAAAVDSAVKLEEAEPDPKVRRPSVARRRLFRIDVSTGATEEIGPPELSVWEFDLLDDSIAAAVVSEDAREQGWYRAHIALVDLAEQTHREVYRPKWQIQSPAIAPSGDWIALTEGWSSDRGLVAGELKAVETESGRVVDLSPHTGDVTWATWRDDESLWFAGWHEMGSRFGVVDLDGGVAWGIDEAATVGTSSFLGNIAPAQGEATRIAAIREAAGEPPELVTSEFGRDSWTPVSAFNGDVLAEPGSYPIVEEVEWSAADGEVVRGLLVRPPDAGRPLPLVVNVHGGPTYAWKHSFDPGFSLPLAGAGFAVLLPNYRGSTGRGQAFTQLNIGDPGGREFEDIKSGVAYCVDEGIADADRVGIMGASYGGYMTAWAVATSRLFAAGVMISGISNLLSCYHTCNNAPFYELILEGKPYDRADLTMYLDRSPIVHVAGATTPTLMLHGADDLCTPLGQAQEFYQALVDQQVPAELVVYPHEGHGFREREHQIDSWQRTRDWFDRYLGRGAS